MCFYLRNYFVNESNGSNLILISISKTITYFETISNFCLIISCRYCTNVFCYVLNAILDVNRIEKVTDATTSNKLNLNLYLNNNKNNAI